MLVVDDGQAQRQMEAAALVEAVTKGRISPDTRVQDGDGQWQSVGRWFLDNSTLIYSNPAGEDRYVRAHARDTISERQLHEMLGLDAVADDIDGMMRSAVPDKIEMPEWGRVIDFVARSNEALVLPDWNPDPAGFTVQRIATTHAVVTVPWWGKPYRLPVPQALTIPEWGDPAAARFELPAHVAMTWEREHADVAEQPDALTELLSEATARYDAMAKRAPQISTAIAPPETRASRRQRNRAAAERIAPAPEAEQKQPETARAHRRSKSRKTRRERKEASRSSHDARHSRRVKVHEIEPTIATQDPAIASEQRSGCAGCLFRLVGLGLVMAIAAIAVDIGFDEVAGEVQTAVQVAPVVDERPQRKQLSPLIELGSRQTLLHIVVALDFGFDDDAELLITLLDTINKQTTQRPNATQPPNTTLPHIVILPLGRAGDVSEALNRHLLSAYRIEAFGKLVAALRADPRALTAAGVRATLALAGDDAAAFERVVSDPQTTLDVRIARTMAAALGMDRDTPLMVNGRPFKRAPRGDSTRLVQLLDRQLKLTDAIRTRSKTSERARQALVRTLPAAVAERFDSWIMQGERLPSTPAATDDELPLRVTIALHKGVPSIGPKSAPVELTIFSDFQCRHCARHAKVIAQLVAELPNDVRVHSLHYPLNRLHPSARAAASAAIAAHSQGVYWPAHRWLFARHDEPGDRNAAGEPEFGAPQLARLALHLRTVAKARKINFSAKKFARDVRRGGAALALDRRLARTLGVDGTPVTFINGRAVRGALAYEQLRALVTSELTVDEQGPP